MLEHALIRDSLGAPIRHGARSRSTDWDEVEAFCRTVYMPYRVRPLERLSRPDATMISARAGRITMTRFAYGTGIHLDRFDPEAGNILVLNTLRGALDHSTTGGSVATGTGESFVVDCSRTDYWLEGDADHMQLNLTIPHDVMAETAERWFGFVPGDDLWTSRVKIGGPGSAWLSLLDYAARALTRPGPVATTTALSRHIEEMLCVELLRQWAAEAGVRLEDGARAAAPGYVRRAEEIMEAEAREAPSIGEVAARVGVSARTLSGGFRRFRGLSPRDFLAARRLDGLKHALETAPPSHTVSRIAADWGFANFGALAARYRDRFGELPSHTRARTRH
ncbi:AraC family transcriptional regulator [Vannielia litorea]|uniref:AraC family transcriptional regulator n=1 Tax=Vannielia litorea TaxID=1217970 RepID=UPI001C9372AB|nr:helix-turn-helix transcriptional regulator [Vannielia litorea]MBY6046516.1 AraC family transcriptional regulator [Vannielia litorea]MBY6073929.1 AraC family transcriptional regulator [Vannielia litorea]